MMFASSKAYLHTLKMHLTDIKLLIRWARLFMIIILMNFELKINNSIPKVPQSKYQQQQKSAIDISFRDVTYQIPVQQNHMGKEQRMRMILNKVSGIFKAGELTAIMGSSGSGKTTLLNIISKRIQVTNQNILANSVSYNTQQFGRIGNYVTQHDIFMPNLTVKETLRFAADLKLNLTEKQKEDRIQNLISQLKLQKCKNTKIGNHMMKSISGGEKRRTSIAYELITDPFVLFLDEPTSGLDSLTSYVVMKYLKKLAEEENKTIVFTIHQPSTQIFHLFDRLILIEEGTIIYQGKASKATEYFHNRFDVPFHEVQNQGEYLISITHQLRSNKGKLQYYAQCYNQNLLSSVEEEIALHNTSEVQGRAQNNSICNIYSVLFRRQAANLFKNSTILVTRLIQTIFIIVFAGGMCYQIGQKDLTDKINWHAITGLLFFLTINGLNNSLNPTSIIFPLERNVFLKQKSSCLYGIVPYFVTRNIIELPYNFIFPFIASIIIYWFVGLNNTPQQFFAFFLIQYLLGFCGSSLGFLLGSIIVDPRSISSGISLIMTPLIVFAGFYKNLGNLPQWINWFQYLSPIKYGFGAMVHNQERYAIASNIGELNLNVGLWGSIGAMFALGISFRLLSLFFLWQKSK